LTERLLILSLIVFAFLQAAKAQKPAAKSPLPVSKAPVSNLHKKYIHVSAGSYAIDSMSIVPGTFLIPGVADSSYQVDYVNGRIFWRHPPPLDSVYVVYRSFPYRINSTVKRLNYDSISNNFLIQPSVYNTRTSPDNFFNFGNITYNGSFGRAISFGNSQDAVVTSNLNLQLSGYLADSIEISAAITDNNIPIQPDGTTAQINDFDRIFLQFRKKNWTLAMGDIDLRQNQNYFLNFYKRLQGASFEFTAPMGNGVTNKTLVSGAVAKGKYNRNIFQGQEGNQGPYRLQGANNELYFVVLAGTEKVYIDGQLLQRGQDQDYVINYNTAEVTFTQKRMITQDSRIQVEFEYSNQYYLNANLYLYNETNFRDKLKLRFGVFSNSDSRNSPINQPLNQDQKKFLFLIGDSINKAFYPVAPLDTLGPGKVLYAKIDTVYKAANGLFTHDSIYVFSVNPSVRLYNLTFSDVGAGNGDYVPSQNGVNGNTYVWVAPVNGQKQGQFAAAEYLVTPKTQQVITLGADYNLSRHTTMTAEYARSHYDVNTLSTLDKKNDDGNAIRMLLKNSHPFAGSARGLELTTHLSYEYVEASFQPVERLRPVEFARDWGLPVQVAPANETLFSGSVQVSDRKKNFIGYEISGYDRGASFTGIRNTFSHAMAIKGWQLVDQISLTNDNSTTTQGYLLRPKVGLSKTLTGLGGYVLGADYSIEHNEMRDKTTDSVTRTSYAFSTLQAFFKSPLKNPNKWGIVFTSRNNSYPMGRDLVKGDKSWNVNVFADLLKSRHQQFRINATYRSLDIVNSKVTAQQPDRSLLGRAEYMVNAWKGMLTGNALYEVGSGQEQKRAFTYLQVPAGTGQFAWIDLNGDGIQQLNEFVPAQFPDQAKFIRVYTPTNQYIKANYNTFNYSIRISPRSLIGAKAKGFSGFLARMMFQSALQLNQKQLADGFVQFNPVKKPVTDSSLISQNSIFTNTFSFNKTSAKWGFDLSNTKNISKILLTYGYQSQVLQEWNLRSRWSLSKSFLLNLVLRKGHNALQNSSSNFDSSNYNLSQYSIEPDISYTRGSNLRVTLGYKYADKVNSPNNGGELYCSNALNSEIKYNIVQNTSLQGKFTFSNIIYTGSTHSTVSYIMLDGLLPGKNYLWGLDFTKKLGSSLELSIQYEGRKPGEGQIIHTGRAALRALL
jgi:hypothetical protein